jgi:bifunctional DNA-binding transcriptional regulator/antitoxin component of YhaV-PrlF toxin-antitoxin module
MTTDGVDAESTVSGTRTTIPAPIRRELDIDDGDRLRWSVDSDGVLRIEVVRRDSGTFGEFEGYDGDEATDARTGHDAWDATD